MNQEKPKVIRVLTPSKKAKKISPMYFGAAAIAIGAVSISALLFSFSKDDSNPPPMEQNSTKPIEQDRLNTQHDSTPQVNSSDIAESDHDAQSDSSHEDFNQPQPKLNEITNLFKHKKEEVVQQHPNASPFDRAFPEKKVLTPAAVKIAPPTLAVKPSLIKPIEQAKIVKKPTEKNTVPIVTKLPTTIKENPKELEVESPRATVQITVTKSVKEN